MTINYFTQSKKDVVPIYVRVRGANCIDAKANTGLLVRKKLFHKGRVKLLTLPLKDSNEYKNTVRLNSELNKLQIKLDKLRGKITSYLNSFESDSDICSSWLKDVLKPKTETNELPNELSSYFDKFLDYKKSSLKSSTLKKLKSIKSRILKYEHEYGEIKIININSSFSKKFQLWCDNVGYDHNTKVKTIKVIKTVCNHAFENGIEVSPQLQFITKGLKYNKTEHVYLSFKELEEIVNTVMPNERLNNAKDWLIISCYTAQRVSDFLRFKKSSVVSLKGFEFLDISQRKTDQPVLVPLNGEVKNVLRQRGGNFPDIFSNNIESNKSIYNKLIKEVCRLAGLNKVVRAKLKNKVTNRYEIIDVPKWKAVSTHIGRRSFATNYYGKINTALLIAATGHSSERQFLNYVGKIGTQNAVALAEELSKFES